jgi:hypothetical protein
LPAECDNQDVVQIRWISKQLSEVVHDHLLPLITHGDQRCCSASKCGWISKISSILSDGFDFLTKINEAGKTYFIVEASGSTTPNCC